MISPLLDEVDYVPDAISWRMQAVSYVITYCRYLVLRSVLLKKNAFWFILSNNNNEWVSRYSLFHTEAGGAIPWPQALCVYWGHLCSGERSPVSGLLLMQSRVNAPGRGTTLLRNASSRGWLYAGNMAVNHLLC